MKMNAKNLKRLDFIYLLTLCLSVLAFAKTDPSVFKSQTPPENAIWVETLDQIQWIEQGYRVPGIGKSVDENPITMDGQVYPHGVGTHSTSIINIKLNDCAVRFASMVGVDDEGKGEGSVVFEIWVDGKMKATSGKLVGLGKPQVMEVDLRGAMQMRLLVKNAGDDYHYDHANWAGAFIELVPETDMRPEIILPYPVENPIPMASGEDVKPSINGPRIVGTTPGKPFLFMIPASGKGPLKFYAKRLPKGLTLDSSTGIITGSLKEKGTYKTKITVKGAKGKTSRNLTIVGGNRKLALTPPMGWNSWNIYGLKVSAEDIKRTADLMVSSGLARHGYSYINIDDGWELDRDENGYIRTNEKFPDMKELSDYVHSKGLKLGIYSSPGPQTCGLYIGSYQYEKQDVESWSKWGIDYLKYDWCLYERVAKDHSLPELQKPYILMRSLLDEADRDIVYSLCQYGMGKVWEWGNNPEIGGNLWRTTGDIVDRWDSMSGIGFDLNGPAKYAGPGHWNDPDMLVVGWLGWGDLPYPTKLRPNEQITHITLWSLQAAPLLLGCDLSKMDQFTFDLLTNDEVIDVNQDPLGQQASRIQKDGDLEVWARPLWDGTYAVGLFNRSLERKIVHIDFSKLGLKGKQPVRDLWQRKDIGKYKASYSAEVPIHGAIMIKIGKPNKKDF